MNSRRSRLLCTVGYEGLTLRAFITRLKAESIQVLFDIRYRPQSRKPGFSKAKLSVACKRAGIEYVHDPKLGTPPDQMAEMRKTGTYTPKLVNKYRRFLLKQVASLQHAANVARGAKMCLMCYEADYRGCHRRIVAQELERLAKVRVNHLSVCVTDSTT
jgi:uncharacterized protein (DUF488 family)